MEPGSDILNKLKESSRELFSVPEGYFESFPAQMLEKAKAEPPAKVVSFGKRLFRYAAVAVVAGIIALGTWLWIKQPGTVDSYTASRADKEVLRKVQNISDSEMVEYIENSSLTATGEKSITIPDLKGETVSLMLAGISDEALQQYLEQHNSSKPLLN